MFFLLLLFWLSCSWTTETSKKWKMEHELDREILQVGWLGADSSYKIRRMSWPLTFGWLQLEWVSTALVPASSLFSCSLIGWLIWGIHKVVARLKSSAHLGREEHCSVCGRQDGRERESYKKKKKKTEDIIHVLLYKGKQKTIEVTIHTITATKNYRVTDNGGE